MKASKLPIRQTMCATCPFRDTGWTHVRDFLQHRALTEGSPICHSTGNALVKRQGKSHICRGARNFQIDFFYRIGFLTEPTDAAWNEKLAQLKTKRK
jgi:hypothetical protein